MKIRYRIRKHGLGFLIEKLDKNYVLKSYRLNPKKTFDMYNKLNNNVDKSQRKTNKNKGEKGVYDVLYEPINKLKDDLKTIWETTK